jgi:hypothetical protein
MQCSHCLQAFHDKGQFMDFPLGQNANGPCTAFYAKCPACSEFIIQLQRVVNNRFNEVLIYPHTTCRPPLPPEVPKEFSDAYQEACAVLSYSEKASAALSRRCLQHLLRERGGVKAPDLAKEIQAVLESKQLPSHLADDLDAIRVLGNFAAHPIKSTNTGEIVEVESGEAQWILDVLSGLLDFYYVQAERSRMRREGLNRKLAEAGKPPMKAP